MIPKTISKETLSEAEKCVFHHLRDSLDDIYTVFHSYDILSRNRDGKVFDGEIDFLIFSPQKGILVIEVKGGIITYDGNTKTWYQNNNKLKMSPFLQAKNNKYKILEYLKKRLKKDCHGQRLPITFGHSVCFPDIFNEMVELPAEADQSIIITGQHLPYISEAISKIMAVFNKKNICREITPKQIKRIKMALAPVFEYGASISDKINIAERRIFSLTEDQCRLLNFLGDRKRVLVEGCAGSGKTVMALKKARQFSHEGKKVLLLVYNRLIAEKLSNAISELSEQIEVSTYHKFCLSKLLEVGVRIPENADSSFWLEEVPDKFSKLLKDSPIKYDAVIVDEGQDFRFEYWCTIEELLKDDAYLYIFYDSDQNLFDTKMVFPINEEPYRLRGNCRNTKEIFNSMRKHIDSDIFPLEDLPNGPPVGIMVAKSEHEQRKNLAKVLHELVNTHKIARENIIILGGHTLEHTWLSENPVVGNYTISKDDGNSNTIQYSTYMAFKGCESDAVILLDVDNKDERWERQSALYTAKSRAKFVLYILRKEY